MHINDVYALRGELCKVLCNESIDRTTIKALLSAACDEITEFEKHIEQMAQQEEIKELYATDY